MMVLSNVDCTRYLRMLERILIARVGVGRHVCELTWGGRTGTLTFERETFIFKMELDGESSEIYPDGATYGNYEGMAQWFVSAHAAMPFPEEMKAAVDETRDSLRNGSVNLD